LAQESASPVTAALELIAFAYCGHPDTS